MKTFREINLLWGVKPLFEEWRESAIAQRMDKYRCTVCGYIYDPAENNNVSFENLPEDWVCPECGVGKDKFEKV